MLDAETGFEGEKIVRKIVNVFLSPISFNICLGAQKGRVIETVPLSTHNICLGWYALLTKVLLK